MSFYSFATANLTTHADQKRRPAVNKGQVTRTLVLCVLFLAALTLITWRSGAEGTYRSPLPAAAASLPGCTSSGDQCPPGNALASPADAGTKIE